MTTAGEMFLHKAAFYSLRFRLGLTKASQARSSKLNTVETTKNPKLLLQLIVLSITLLIDAPDRKQTDNLIPPHQLFKLPK